MKFQEIFEKLGLTGTKWQWRAMRWDRALERTRQKFSGEKQHVGYRNKFCPKCRALIDRNEKTCPHCGARAGSWHAQATGRAINRLLPGDASVTGTLIVVNLIIYFGGILFTGLSALFNPPRSFVVTMAMISPLFTGGQYWRIITYGFLHFGVIHILFNMLALYYAGSLLEEEIGKARFFAIYTISMLGGGAFYLYAAGGEPIPMGGASGAVFGLIGFGAAYGHFLGGPRGEAIRGFFMRWVMFAVIFSIMVAHISVSTHLGGLAVGGLFGYLVANEDLTRREISPTWGLAARISAGAIVGAFLWMLAALL